MNNDLMEGSDPMDDLKLRRQCTAKSKQSGERCRRAPIRGGNVCSMHGGGSPQAQKSARERLASLAEPAIDALKRALEDGDISATIRAAQLILDRTGFHPTQTITGENGKPFKFTMDLGNPITQITNVIVGPTERYLKWIPADRIALMRAWFREGMLAEHQKKPPLHDDSKPLLSTEE